MGIQAMKYEETSPAPLLNADVGNTEEIVGPINLGKEGSDVPVGFSGVCLQFTMLQSGGATKDAMEIQFYGRADGAAVDDIPLFAPYVDQSGVINPWLFTLSNTDLLDPGPTQWTYNIETKFVGYELYIGLHRTVGDKTLSVTINYRRWYIQDRAM